MLSGSEEESTTPRTTWAHGEVRFFRGKLEEEAGAVVVTIDRIDRSVYGEMNEKTNSHIKLGGMNEMDSWLQR